MNKKKATLLVMQKRYEGDCSIDNVINYACNSIHADLDNILTNEISDCDINQMICDFYRIQEPYPCLEKHRRLFHIILTARYSKGIERNLNEGAYALYDYLVTSGHQCLMVPHVGSDHNDCHYHYHVIINVKSYTDGTTMLDKYTTYQAMIDYMNNHPISGLYTQWNYKYSGNKKVKLEEYI